MPQRGIEISTWNHIDFQALSRNAKLLFLYLITTPRGNQAGMYSITTKSIVDDTGLPKKQIPGLLKELEKLDVMYFPEKQVVWVKNFLKYQTHSEKFLVAVAKSLVAIHDDELVTEFLEYNRAKHKLSIPYQYVIDKLSISESGSGTESEKIRDVASLDTTLSPYPSGKRSSRSSTNRVAASSTAKRPSWIP